MDARKDLPALTAVRFLAALAVTLYHYAKPVAASTWAENVVSHGFLGVSFFFALSGFILVYVSRGREMNTREFLIRRVARIYPVYLFAWALTGLVLLLRSDISASYAIKAVGLWGGLSLAVVQAWIPGAAPQWNWPGWSLSCEAFFYLSFPIVFAYLPRLTNRSLWICAAGLVVASTLKAFLTYSLDDVQILSATPFKASLGGYLDQLPALAIVVFLLGAITAELYTRGARIHHAYSLVFVGLFLAVMMAPKSPWTVALAVPLSCGLIASLAELPWKMPRFAILLGNASYAMYIVQFPLWDLLGTGSDAPTTVTGLLLFCALLIGTSIAIHLSIERPAERWIKQRFTSRHVKVAPITA